MLYVEYMTETWADSRWSLVETIQNDVNHTFKSLQFNLTGETHLTVAHKPHPLQPQPISF